MSNTILLERFYAPDGTFGTMSLPGDVQFYSIERPWLGNANDISCIPEGIYPLKKRYSPVVKRSSGGEFEEGWEICDVPNREFIMLHPANWIIDLKGCVGMGLDYVIMQDRTGRYRNSVSDSREAFRQLMGILDQSDYWDIAIQPKLIQYP